MNQCTPEQQMDQREVKREIKNYIETSGSLSRTYQKLMGCSINSAEKGVYSIEHLQLEKNKDQK